MIPVVWWTGGSSCPQPWSLPTVFHPGWSQQRKKPRIQDGGSGPTEDTDGVGLYLPGSWAGEGAGISHLWASLWMFSPGLHVPQGTGGGGSCPGGSSSLNGGVGGSDFLPMAFCSLGQAGWRSHALSQAFSMTPRSPFPPLQDVPHGVPVGFFSLGSGSRGRVGMSPTHQVGPVWWGEKGPSSHHAAPP